MNFLKRDELLFLVLWSSGYVGAKIGIPLSGTFTILFYRYALVVLIVGLIIGYKKQWQLPTIHTLTLGFLAHFFWLVCILKSFEYGMNAGSAALIAALQPILTALVAAGVLAEKNTKLEWLGVLTGFVGVCIFVSGDRVFSGTPLWVYLLPLAATVSLTLITIMERKNSSKQKKELPIMVSLFWQATVTLILLIPLAWKFENFYADLGINFLFSVAWLAIVVSILAYGMMFYLIRTREATRVSALQYFVPATTMIIAYIVFKESVSLMGIFGLTITSIGFYLLHKGNSLKNHEGMKGSE
ncbi:DMT family transporter [Marinomonas sp. 2405UD68-3]|uniref:DMT family transporter n=1 Tax=Marinomonas sp. 2405UD68-3 TaxID=3391835 RepID=UPI0039C9D081